MLQPHQLYKATIPWDRLTSSLEILESRILMSGREPNGPLISPILEPLYSRCRATSDCMAKDPNEPLSNATTT